MPTACWHPCRLAAGNAAHTACHCLLSPSFLDQPRCSSFGTHGPCCRAGAIASNLRKLHAAKRAFNKHKPQAVLYIDRLDAGRRDMADLNVSAPRDSLPRIHALMLRRGRPPRAAVWASWPVLGELAASASNAGTASACPLSPPLQVLRSITEVFGQDMWFSTVLLLTHGGAPPPDTR